MATPTADTYTAASGESIGAGRPATGIATLSLSLSPSVVAGAAAPGSITNTFSAPVAWSLSSSPSATISPSSGTLAPGASVSISVTPASAGSYSITLTAAGATISGSPATLTATGAAPGPDPLLMRHGALLGQSNMENPFSDRIAYPSGAPNAKAYKLGALRRIGNIADGSPPGSLPATYGAAYTAADPLVQGDPIVYLGNDLAAAAGQQIVLFPLAVGGSTSSTWLSGGANWQTYATAVAASGLLPRWAVWLQGESDAGMDAATYGARLVSIQAQLVAQSGRAAAAYGFAVVPLGPAAPGPNSNTTWTPEGNMAPLRTAQVAHAASAAGAYLVNAGLDATLRGDGIHWVIASYVRSFRRYAEWVRRWAAGNGGQLAGPRISGATRSGTQITVAIAHAGGTALLDGAGGAGSALAGFRVYDGGVQATISSTAILSPTSVRLTLSAVPSGTVTMDFGMANLPFGSTTPAPASILYDNTAVANDTVGIPLQPKSAFTVT